MRPKVNTLKMRGKSWKFMRRRIRAKYIGLCDPPDKPGKAITVHSGLKGKEEMETILHELTHAGHWDLKEEAVDSFAYDATQVLWRLGYRKVGDTVHRKRKMGATVCSGCSTLLLPSDNVCVGCKKYIDK